MLQHNQIRPYFDSTTAFTIATSIVHSKLGYCNSFYYNLPKSQIARLQQIQNSLARAVVKAPKSCHITPILRSLHWLKTTERIDYKLFSLTYKVLTTIQLTYLHNLISVQPPRSNRSSSLVTLVRPPTSSSLRITDRSFRYASPCLWNQLPSFLHQPNSSPSVSDLPVHARFPVNPPLSPITIHSFLSLSLPAQDLPLSQIFLIIDSLPDLKTDSTALWLDRFCWASRFLVFFIAIFCLVACGRLSWLCQLMGARKYSASYRIV